MGGACGEEVEVGGACGEEAEVGGACGDEAEVAIELGGCCGEDGGKQTPIVSTIFLVANIFSATYITSCQQFIWRIR